LSQNRRQQVKGDTSLTELEIDLDNLVYVADHDGNIHPKDIGKDYLCDLLGYESAQEFERSVKEIRNSPFPHTDSYLNGEVHSEGEELSILISDNEISKQDLLNRVEENSFRQGAIPFVQDLVDAEVPVSIISAGDRDFLGELYQQALGECENFYLEGTQQQWSKNGKEERRAEGIIKGCGKDKKVARLEENLGLNFTESDNYFIASGDSSGDRKLLEYARETGGLAISTGEGAKDYSHVWIDDENWYGHIAATLAYAGLVSGLDEETIVNDASRYLKSNFNYADDLDNIKLNSGGFNDRLLTSQRSFSVLGDKVAQLGEEILNA